MDKATSFLVALALALAIADVAAGAGRRSRFLATFSPPPQLSSYYDCVKKKPSVCLEAGSPGKTCCKGVCTDTESSAMTCGHCNHACKLDETCCRGECVNLMSDHKNCGACFNQCPEKCMSGLCNYAG